MSSQLNSIFKRIKKIEIHILNDTVNRPTSEELSKINNHNTSYQCHDISSISCSKPIQCDPIQPALNVSDEDAMQNPLKLIDASSQSTYN